MTLDATLLEVMACPYCVTREENPPDGLAKGALKLIGEEQHPEALQCQQCNRKYGIQDGIPNMLIDDAFIADPGNV